MSSSVTPSAARLVSGQRLSSSGFPKIAVSIIVWLLLLSAPFWLPLIGGYTALGSRVLVFALTAMGLNLLLGFTGGLAFGHAAYFGLGAYGTGLMLKLVTGSTLLAILVGVLVGGFAAIVAGLLTAKRRGIYFAMITIAIGQLFYFVVVRWNSFTGGADGLTGFSRTNIGLGSVVLNLQQPVAFYYFTLFFFAIGCAIVWRVLHSPLGHTFVAVRENRRRLRFVGQSAWKYVWISFAISGFIVALAGSLFTLLNNFASPKDLVWQLSGIFVICCVMGGMRTFWGPVLGAAIYVVVQDYLSSITVNWMSFIGVLFVLIVLFFPLGLLGLLHGQGRK